MWEFLDWKSWQYWDVPKDWILMESPGVADELFENMTHHDSFIMR